jgi:hypothetical protein
VLPGDVEPEEVHPRRQRRPVDVQRVLARRPRPVGELAAERVEQRGADADGSAARTRTGAGSV